MSYYARWSGNLKLKQKPSQDELSQIFSLITVDYYDESSLCIETNDMKKYDEAETEAMLEKLVPFVASGELDYTGEDEARWRYVFKDGCWEEEQGVITYESELPVLKDKTRQENLINRIINMLGEYARTEIDSDWTEIKEQLTNIMTEAKIFQ